jgi:hypothetical protein
MATILPEEKPKSYKKKQSIETLKMMKPFLEPSSVEFARKDLAKKYSPDWVKSLAETKESMMTEGDTGKLIKKLKGSYSGMKYVVKKVYKNLTSKPNYKD